jgi:glyoxylate reductase
MKKRILITSLIPDAAYQKLSRFFQVTWNKKQLTETQLASKIKPFHAVLTTLADPVTAKVLNAAPNLRCVANFAVGFNNIDLPTAKSRGIWVTNTPDVLTEATADLVWALILACARRVPEGEKFVRTTGFKGWGALFLLGQDLFGKTLGIYGFGRIGKAVAWRGRGWNMPVLYHQRHRESPAIEKRYNAKYVSLKILLSQSDILSVNSPLTPETKHRFAFKEFKQMKHNSLFINAARGMIHNEADLAKALQTKVIASAGLDVYEFEPKINQQLLKLSNCTLLPHLGSATLETRTQMALLAAENIELVLLGKKPKTPVILR